MSRLVRFSVRHPRTTLGGLVLVTAFFALDAAKVRIESSLASVLPTGDPAVAYYEHTRDLFGSDDVAVVGVRAPNVLAPETLTKIAHLTDALAKVPGVSHVLSLTNAVDIAADVFVPPKLLPRIPPTEADVAALERTLAARSLYAENFLAPDHTGAAINVVFRPMSQAEYESEGIDAAIRKVLDEAGGPEKFYFTGAGHVTQAAVTLMRDDLWSFTPVALLLVVATLWWSFRTKRGVALPLAAVGAALVWTFGSMVLLGKSITLGTFVLPPLLLVVGSAYAIHVMSLYYEQAEQGGDAFTVTAGALDRVWVPVGISGLTTVVGFASLMVNRIPAIFELGLFAVIGVSALVITSLTLLPAMLVLMSVERVSARARDGRPFLDGALERLASWVSASRRWVLLVGGVATAIALVGATHIQADSDFLDYFSRRAQVRRDAETINQQIVGSNPFYVVVEAPKGQTVDRWETLRLIRELDEYIETLPGITSVISIVDYLELLESGLVKGTGNDLVVDDQGNIVPAAPPKPFWEEPKNLGPVLELIKTSPDTFSGVVTKDFRATSLLVRTRLSGSRAVHDTVAAIRAFVAERFPASLRVHETGNLVLLNDTTTELIRGQIRSLATALTVIFVVMALMFLSLRIGLLAMLPNVVPIVVFFGILGWGGFYLNLGTSLIGAVVLGLAIDSTIHYMTRFNRELRGETDQGAAITRTLRAVGAPLIYTTVALVLGFLTFGFSSFVPIQTFGLLSSVTLVTALASNLALLPALLATTKIITLWDLVGVRLGEDPERTIPLFAGLRPSQARVVVLMGEVRTIAPGEYLVRQGEVGDEMYVVLEGKADVHAGADGAKRYVASYGRGDVLGEMGLVRHHERSADVVATTPLEVLAVNESFLGRIQRRYPRIAAKVFLNLTRILSDRLQATTDRFVAERGEAS
jgi:predicted RND superfamily exporter protein